MAVAPARLLTYDDLPETADERKRYEIISGRMVVTPVPVPVHQQVCTRLGVWSYNFVERNRLGVLYTSAPDVRLSPHDVVVPDLVFVSNERRDIVGPNLIDGAPDLIVEVLSPSTRTRDRREKAALYARSGVREYWLVDPRARAVTVRALESGEETTVRETGVVRSTVLPGFEVDVAELFADLW